MRGNLKHSFSSYYRLWKVSKDSHFGFLGPISAAPAKAAFRALSFLACTPLPACSSLSLFETFSKAANNSKFLFLVLSICLPPPSLIWCSWVHSCLDSPEPATSPAKPGSVSFPCLPIPYSYSGAETGSMASGLANGFSFIASKCFSYTRLIGVTDGCKQWPKFSAFCSKSRMRPAE